MNSHSGSLPQEGGEEADRKAAGSAFLHSLTSSLSTPSVKAPRLTGRTERWPAGWGRSTRRSRRGRKPRPHPPT